MGRTALMNDGFHATVSTRWPGVRAALCLLLAGAWPALAQPTNVHVEPSAARATLGSTIVFCIQPDYGTSVTYQWRKNGVSLPGETNRCLSLTNVAIADGGSYRAAVSDATGATESEEAILQILITILSANDSFKGGTGIAAVSNSVRGVSFTATREITEPIHAGLLTSNSVWYTWRAPSSGIVTFDTRGSTYDTVLAVYTGTDLAGLTELTADDDSGGFHTSRVRWNAEAGVDYHIAIDGVTGETGNYICNWLLEPTDRRQSVIEFQPRSHAAPLGGKTQFEVSINDFRLPLQLQWFHNDQPIPGATKATLTIDNVQAADLGRYYLAITNAAGLPLTTETAELEIGPIPNIVSHDKIAELPSAGGGGGGGGGDAQPAFAASGASGGTFSLAAGTVINQRFFNAGTKDRCEPAHCGVAGGASRWFQLAAVTDGICTIDTLNSDVDTVLAVYLQNFSICTNLYEPLVDCNNDVLGTCNVLIATNAPRERGSRVSFFAPAGSLYRAVVDTAGGTRGTNIQFNVRFETSATIPTNAVTVGPATNSLLQLRGSDVTLRVGDTWAQPGNTYQWAFNGRDIAGAVRDRLFLPNLNYSDAGRYSVTVRAGTALTRLPETLVLVLDPCRDNGPANPPVRFVGSSPETVTLESRSSLATTSSWQTIGPIPRSTEPVPWNAGEGNGRFYRVRRPAQ